MRKEKKRKEKKRKEKKRKEKKRKEKEKEKKGFGGQVCEVCSLVSLRLYQKKKKKEIHQK